jgi:hypothetical protein
MTAIGSAWKVRKQIFRALLLLLLIVLCAVGTVANVLATTYHSPPWADNFHYTFDNGDHTRDAAVTAAARQGAVGYAADGWHNLAASSVRWYMQNDAVWSMYSHAYRDGIMADNGPEISWLFKWDIKSLNLSGMRVAVFYGCRTAEGPDSDHLTNSAVQAGAGASLGFYLTVPIGSAQDAPATSPPNVWSTPFWNSMQWGNSINSAAAYARDQYYAARGGYDGLDAWSTWGNGGQTITPAGYK